MLNVVHYSFVPNAASTNRLISYLVNVPKGIKCRVFFIMPDEHNSMWENNLENIRMKYSIDKGKLFPKVVCLNVLKLGEIFSGLTEGI